MIIAKLDPCIIDKIPEHCKDCPFVWNDYEFWGDICTLTWDKFQSDDNLIDFDMETQRLPNCPLVEVKEG